MVLSDALYYLTTTYKPHTVMTVATLTGAMVVALGDVYTGAFCSNQSLWEELHKAGSVTGDQFWRMPFHANYRELMTQSNVADLANLGAKNGGGSCSAAAFLREFIPRQSEPPVEPLDMNEDTTLQTRYAHLDIAGVMESSGDSGYHVKGMSGKVNIQLDSNASRPPSTFVHRTCPSAFPEEQLKINRFVDIPWLHSRHLNSCLLEHLEPETITFINSKQACFLKR